MSCGQIALERNGIPVNNYFASEIDKHAIKVTLKNYPNTIQLGDIRNLNVENLPKIDLLIGGSPCQSFSFAGKMNGMSTKNNIEVLDLNQYINLKNSGFEFDGQSYLFWEYVRVLFEIKSINKNILFLLENVRMTKKWQDVISKTLEVEPIEINSNLVSAQDRKRLYWTNIKDVSHPKDRKVILKDILEENVDRKYDITERFYKKKIGTLAYKKSRSNIRTPLQKSKALLTGGHNISNSGSTNIFFTDEYIRIPTPKECERLQNVPDDYTFGFRDSERYKMLGNGWTVDVIAHILKNIKYE